MKLCYPSYLFVIELVISICNNGAQAQIDVIRSIDVPSSTFELQFLGSANMDSDPNEELAYYNFRDDMLWIVDGNTGALEWDSSTMFSAVYVAGAWNTGGINYGFSPPFCDINGDGVMEITFSGGKLDSPGLEIFVVGLQGTNGSIPKELSLSQNYPNPFNLSTTIDYEITSPGHVEIRIYDVTGRQVRTLVQQELSAGEYSVLWDGKNAAGIQVSSGPYFYRMKVGDYTSAKKAILLK